MADNDPKDFSVDLTGSTFDHVENRLNGNNYVTLDFGGASPQTAKKLNIPDDVWKSALDLAKDVRQVLAKEGKNVDDIVNLQGAKKLDNNPKLTDQKLAAELLAISVAGSVNQLQQFGSNKSATFDGEISKRDNEIFQTKPEHVAALAKRIFEDHELKDVDQAERASVNAKIETTGFQAKC